jgi:TrmH family RNA methyltransferase
MVDIILMEPENEGNVGAVARVMANFGFKNLIIIRPKCNLENDELYRRMKHARGKVRISVKKRFSKYDVLIGTTSKVNKDYNLLRSALSLEKLPNILSRSGKRKIALVFGREGIGLTNDELKRCNILVSVNTSIEYPTLNLSHAVAIVLYVLSLSAKNDKLLKNIKPADNEDFKILNNLTGKLIAKAGFTTDSM